MPNRHRPRLRLRWLLLAALVAPAAPLAAQATGPTGSAGDSVIVYRREVFRYPAGGRPDPFRSLVGSADLGVRVEDLTLRGIVYHPDPARSVAILVREGVERPFRARVGDRIGGIRILAIGTRSIELLIEELGVARRETLQITRAPTTGDS